MLDINYTKDAISSLARLINFIESKNTKGAGNRWLVKYELFLIETLSEHIHLPFCKNVTFQKFTLKCIFYKDWIIAFSLNENKILIEAFIHKSRIRY